MEMLKDEGGYLPEELAPTDESTGGLGQSYAIWLIALAGLITLLLGQWIRQVIKS